MVQSQDPIPNGVKSDYGKRAEALMSNRIFYIRVGSVNIDMGYFAACGVIVCGAIWYR